MPRAVCTAQLILLLFYSTWRNKPFSFCKMIHNFHPQKIVKVTQFLILFSQRTIGAVNGVLVLGIVASFTALVVIPILNQAEKAAITIFRIITFFLHITCKGAILIFFLVENVFLYFIEIGAVVSDSCQYMPRQVSGEANIDQLPPELVRMPRFFQYLDVA